MERVQITPSTITFTITLIAALALAFFVRHLLLICLIGIGIGVLLTPLLRFFHNKLRVPKGLAALLVLVLLVLIFSVILGSLYLLVADQARDLTQKAPEIYTSLNAWFQSVINDYPWLAEEIRGIEIGNTVRRGLFGIFHGFRSGVFAAGMVVFTFVLAIYTSVNARFYFEKTVEAFPVRYRKKVSSVLGESAGVLRRWFSAQVIDMSITGLLTGLGLMLAGVPYWAVFGLLTATFQIIPYVGIFIVIAVASLITLASDPSKLPWVLGVFLATQQLENHVILPLVMKGKAELPVVPLLIFMLIMGSFYGILGVFVAPGLLAVLRVVYINVYLESINKA